MVVPCQPLSARATLPSTSRFPTRTVMRSPVAAQGKERGPDGTVIDVLRKVKSDAHDQLVLVAPHPS